MLNAVYITLGWSNHNRSDVLETFKCQLGLEILRDSFLAISPMPVFTPPSALQRVFWAFFGYLVLVTRDLVNNCPALCLDLQLSYCIGTLWASQPDERLEFQYTQSWLMRDNGQITGRRFPMANISLGKRPISCWPIRCKPTLATLAIKASLRVQQFADMMATTKMMGSKYVSECQTGTRALKTENLLHGSDQLNDRFHTFRLANV
ncbi:hypothetical protein RF11_16213 [Thelohanellus kitauei]|uniref:Uncharacterized protein n=1 Tax=Thelohanellus kitauei TaxID=669202 RepID=A0A0C2ME03_THEKT|nr:hypothetical protein RF11_16213 [Thelohanellus kitauei]